MCHSYLHRHWPHSSANWIELIHKERSTLLTLSESIRSDYNTRRRNIIDPMSSDTERTQPFESWARLWRVQHLAEALKVNQVRPISVQSLITSIGSINHRHWLCSMWAAIPLVLLALSTWPVYSRSIKWDQSIQRGCLWRWSSSG